MSFTHLIARLGDWAGWQKIQTLAQNYNAARTAFLAEHNRDGAHNIYRVSRALGLCLYDSSLDSYSFSGLHPGVTSVTKIGTGIVDLLFSDATWTDEDYLFIEVTLSPLSGYHTFEYGAHSIYYGAPLYSANGSATARIGILKCYTAVDTQNFHDELLPGILPVDRSFFFTVHHFGAVAVTGAGLQSLPVPYESDNPWLSEWTDDLFSLPARLQDLFAATHHRQTGRHNDVYVPRAAAVIRTGEVVARGENNYHYRHNYYHSQDHDNIGIRKIEPLDGEGQCCIWWEHGIFKNANYGVHVHPGYREAEPPVAWQNHVQLIEQEKDYVVVQTKVWESDNPVYEYEDADRPFIIRAWQL